MKRFKKFQIPNDEKGSVVIILVAFISILITLSLHIIKQRITASNDELFVINNHKAQYLAESGIRYAQALDIQDDNNLTVIQKSDGSFVSYPDEPLAPMETGVQIVVKDCRQITATGIVGKNSSFEVIKEFSTGMHFKGLPCWRFEEGSGNVFDYCSGHIGLEFQTPERTCHGRYGEAIQFNGFEYVETSFDPFCEIGDDQSFIITFWAKPSIIDGVMPGGTLFGVQGKDANDEQSKFAIRIINEEWVMFLGTLSPVKGPKVSEGWQHILVHYDAFTEKVEITRTDSVSSEIIHANLSEMSGNPTFPKAPKNIYIGAEHGADSAFFHYHGEIDELVFHDPLDVKIEDLKPTQIVNKIVASYALDEEPDETTVSDDAGNFEGTRHDAVSADGRYGCPNHAYSFNNIDQYIEADDKMISDYPFSVNIWFSTSEVDGEHVLYSMTDKDDEKVQFGVYINSNGFPCLRAKNGDAAAGTCVSDGDPLNDGRWHLISAVFSSNSKRKLFVDGSIKNGGSETPVPFPKSLIDRWSIGRWGNGNGYFSGVIDDVSVYAKPLSKKEIQTIFDEGNPY